MESPRPTRSVWMWPALGLGGLAIAGLGAVLLTSAWNGYMAANPAYLRDLADPPPVTGGLGTQATVAVAMLTLGYLSALVASLVRLRSTGVGWLLLRAVAALIPIPISLIWLRAFFLFFVGHLCGDCSPFEPTIPDVFAFGSGLLNGAVVVGLILCVVFFAFAIFRFVRALRKPSTVAQR